MAQTLSKQSSPERCERAARRHLRLTKRTNNAQALALAQRIEAPRAALAERIAALNAAREATQDAFDDWVADDQAVDDLLGSLGRKAVDYDKEHPKAETYTLLFYDQTVSRLIRTKRDEQPDVVAKVLKRAESLPEGHPGAAIIPTLTEANERVRQSHAAYLRTMGLEAEAVAATEVAKLALVQAYRDNAIDLAREVGEQIAERCFPRLSAPRKTGSGDDDAEG